MREPNTLPSIVITDSSIVINLSHTGHLRLLEATGGFRFAVADEVVAEITEAAQRDLLEAVLTEGVLSRESLSSPQELEVYAELSRILGSGESACLALTMQRGWLVACDERRVFLREARNRLGAGRILNTAGIYVLWIRQGLLTIDQADAAKQLLEARRFRFAFQSFRDVI